MIYAIGREERVRLGRTASRLAGRLGNPVRPQVGRIFVPSGANCGRQTRRLLYWLGREGARPPSRSGLRGQPNSWGLEDEFLREADRRRVADIQDRHVGIEDLHGGAPTHDVGRGQQLEPLTVVPVIHTNLAVGKKLDHHAQSLGIRIADLEDEFLDFIRDRAGHYSGFFGCSGLKQGAGFLDKDRGGGFWNLHGGSQGVDSERFKASCRAAFREFRARWRRIIHTKPPTIKITAVTQVSGSGTGAISPGPGASPIWKAVPAKPCPKSPL